MARINDMEEAFEISIEYKGMEQRFDGQLFASRYIHWMVVNINGKEVNLKLTKTAHSELS
jgi:hypothetical protein